MTYFDVVTSAGHSIAVTSYGLPKSNSILVIAPATGVKQSFYGHFAEYMARHGIWVLTFDYMGIGDSLRGPITQLKGNAQEWGSVDLEAVLSFVMDENPHGALCILGHSIGGQLIGLAPTSRKASRIILVGAQSGYWKFWPGLSRIKMLFYWYFLLPSLTWMFGYFPGKKILGMENLPKNMALQWRYWCTLPNYILDDVPPEQLFYKDIDARLLVISMERDTFAPLAAVEYLSNCYGSENRKRLHIHNRDYQMGNIGHFGVFKKKMKESLWPVLLHEIQLSNPQ
ncbi:alpha/beta hydrolase family protein [Flagellimonas hymeniacidonis]|uniref:alpha/beta hydrolase family protein n=1 Tax=Flagellimonas hymeniacidonis TaxID=2603628 RepID=UPI00164FAF3D|nr:alpha/beta fold hydrolase [Flagellimonas hymeniacidonis]